MNWPPYRPRVRHFTGALKKTVAGVAVFTLCAGLAQAQGFGPDPFRPYNSQYDRYIYPISPLDYGSNNAPMSGTRSANQFQNFMNSIQGMAGRGGSGAGTPYFEAHRAYDREFKREYRPNRDVDASFDANRDTANELYFKYLREKDPKKRVDLLRQYNQARSRSERELTTGRGGARTAAPSSPGGPRSTAARALEGNDGGRDLGAAPAPLSTGRSRTRPGRTAGGSAESATGPGSAPPPLGRSSSATGVNPGATPSQILERATRSGSPRTAPRRPLSSTRLPDEPPPP